MEKVTFENLINSLPYEVLVQWSKQTDDIEVFIESIEEISNDENISILEALLYCTKETLGTYEGNGDNRHINYDLKFEDKETWLSERKEIKAFIRKIEKLI